MNIALNEIGAAVLSNAVLVVPLAVLAAVFCRFVQRPAVAWCLWGLVLLKFVTPAWYPCVPSWTSSRMSSTFGASSGGSGSIEVEQSLVPSDQAQTMHRASSHAESSETSVNRRDSGEGVTGKAGLLNDVDLSGQRALSVDNRTSDSASTVPPEIKIAADAEPPPPPLPQDLPDTPLSLRAGSVSARSDRAAASAFRAATANSRPERPRPPP